MAMSAESEDYRDWGRVSAKIRVGFLGFSHALIAIMFRFSYYDKTQNLEAVVVYE